MSDTETTGAGAGMKRSFHNAPRDAGPQAEAMIDSLQQRLRDAEAEANRARVVARARPQAGALDLAGALAVVTLLDAATAELLPGEAAWASDGGNTLMAAQVAAAVARISGEPPESCLPGVRGILRARSRE